MCDLLTQFHTYIYWSGSLANWTTLILIWGAKFARSLKTSCFPRPKRDISKVRNDLGAPCLFIINSNTGQAFGFGTRVPGTTRTVKRITWKKSNKIRKKRLSRYLGK